MNPLPNLRGSAQQALYPITKRVVALTKVTTFWNGSEQRFPTSLPMYDFVLPMSALLAADKLTWLNYQTSELGRASGTQVSPWIGDISLTLGATTYSNLVLMSDSISVTNTAPLQYDQSISLRQTMNYPYTVPTVGSSFPNLQFGTGSATTACAEMPFMQVTSFLTSVNDSPSGQRFSYVWYDDARPNMPNNPLHSWILSYPLLTDVDAAILENYYLGCQGKTTSFTFTDPLSGTPYSHVRFDDDSLEFRMSCPNQQTVTIHLRETFNS
jgi:hypothetical protein